MRFIDEVRAELAKRQREATSTADAGFDVNFDAKGGITHGVTAPPASVPPVIQEAHAALASFSGPDDIDDLCAALEAASEISLDLETTHLTPWSPPLRLGTTAKIGTGETIGQYISAHPGCTLDPHPRARIFAFEIDKNFIAAVDLDQLDHDQKIRLIRAVARPDAK